MDRGAWRAQVHRVAKSWTRLKQLSTHVCTQILGRTSITLLCLLIPCLLFFLYCDYSTDAYNKSLPSFHENKYPKYISTERLHFDFSLSCIGEGNGNPLQCSCLENPRDGGAWWVAVYGVAQSRIRLKRLSSSNSHNIIPYHSRLLENSLAVSQKVTQRLIRPSNFTIRYIPKRNENIST